MFSSGKVIFLNESFDEGQELCEVNNIGVSFFFQDGNSCSNGNLFERNLASNVLGEKVEER